MPNDQPSGLSIATSPVWNPLQVDTYDFHLAALCATNPVVATQNIYSADGQLVFSVGDLITSNALKPISTQTLAKPLAHCVSIQRTMSNKDLCQHMLHVIRGTEFFQALEERQYPLEWVRSVSEMLEQYPVVQQRLTVMAAQMGDLFQRTLCVGLWTIFIAQEMRLPSEKTYLIFWAAITHDFGMMHIPPELLAKQEELTAEEWITLQSHVEISRAILMDVGDFSDEMVQAVYEHHERCDGTGYPLGKVESEISLFGQILALADGLVGIYFNRFKPYGRRWREVIPVLELNRSAYLYRACDIVSTMIFRSELPLGDVVEGSEVPEFAERIEQQTLFLQRWFAELNSALTSLGFTHGDRKLHSLQNVVLHIATTFRGSLFFGENKNGFLERVGVESVDAKNAHKAMEDRALRQQEMSFHLHRLTHMLQIYLRSDCKNPEIKRKLDATLKKIGGFISPPAA